MSQRIVCLLARNSDWNTAQQMSWVTRGLAQQGVSVTACVWNCAREFSHDPQFQSERECFDLDAAPRLDFPKLAMLAKNVRSWKPDVIHFWGTDPWMRLLGSCFAHRAAYVRTSFSVPNSARHTLFGRLTRNWVDVRWSSRPESAAVLIPPCVPISKPSADTPRPSVFREFRLPDDAVLLGTTPDGASHLRDLVWTMQLLQVSNEKIHLLIWARRGEHEYLRRQCHAWGVDNHFHFLDPVSRGDCLTHLGAYWAGQSDWTGMLESMMAGTPVFAVSSPGIQDLVHDGVTGFLYPYGNVGILARKSHLLLSDARRHESIAKAARQRVETHFSVDQTVCLYRALYDELIQNQTARATMIDRFAPLVR